MLKPLQMQSARYLHSLRSKVNQPLSLEILLTPFQLTIAAAASPYLLVGHLLDALESEGQSLLDPMDVVVAAYELGYDEAHQFLIDGPRLIVDHLRTQRRTRSK